MRPEIAAQIRKAEDWVAACRTMRDAAEAQMLAAVEHHEERTLGPLVGRVLTRDQAQVSRHPGQPLALAGVERREQSDATDLLGRYHVSNRSRVPKSWMGDTRRVAIHAPLLTAG